VFKDKEVLVHLYRQWYGFHSECRSPL